jgi:hypothetical protein
MKKLLILAMVAMMVTSCGKNFHDKYGNIYETKGIAHFATDKQDECVEYDFSIGNIILGTLFFATAIAPVYFFGFSAMNPTSVDYDCLAASKD